MLDRRLLRRLAAPAALALRCHSRARALPQTHSLTRPPSQEDRELLAEQARLQVEYEQEQLAAMEEEAMVAEVREVEAAASV